MKTNRGSLSEIKIFTILIAFFTFLSVYSFFASDTIVSKILSVIFCIIIPLVAVFKLLSHTNSDSILPGISIIYCLILLGFVVNSLEGIASELGILFICTVMILFASIWDSDANLDKIEQLKLDLDEEYKESEKYKKEFFLCSHKIYDLEKEKEELTNKNKELKENISILRTRICELTDRNEELHDEIDELNKDIKEHNRDWIKVKRLSSEIEKLKEKQNEHLNKIAELEKVHNNRGELIKEILSANKNSTQKLEHLQSEFSKLEKENKQLIDANIILKKELEKKRLVGDSLRLKKTLDDLERDKAFLLAKLDLTYKDGFECLDDDIL